jgi:hypothetical protein
LVEIDKTVKHFVLFRFIKSEKTGLRYGYEEQQYFWFITEIKIRWHYTLKKLGFDFIGINIGQIVQ